jgi:hypothetical protein
LDSADYNNNKLLSASAYAKNYAYAFPSDCPAAFNGSDHRAPSKLAACLETLATRLSRAERRELAPHLSADALAKATGEAAIAHTAGACAACHLLRMMLPLQLRGAGLPRAHQGPPAGAELFCAEVSPLPFSAPTVDLASTVRGVPSTVNSASEASVVTYIYTRIKRNAKRKTHLPESVYLRRCAGCSCSSERPRGARHRAAAARRGRGTLGHDVRGGQGSRAGGVCRREAVFRR